RLPCSSVLRVVFCVNRRHPPATLFPYTTRFRSPSTGLPTHTSQGDLTFSFFLSHGDTDFVILLPGNVNECFEFGWRALDIADERSEEHTSELHSRDNLVCRLLLEKKNSKQLDST